MKQTIILICCWLPLLVAPLCRAQEVDYATVLSRHINLGKHRSAESQDYQMESVYRFYNLNGTLQNSVTYTLQLHVEPDTAGGSEDRVTCVRYVMKSSTGEVVMGFPQFRGALVKRPLVLIGPFAVHSLLD